MFQGQLNSRKRGAIKNRLQIIKVSFLSILSLVKIVVLLSVLELSVISSRTTGLKSLQVKSHSWFLLFFWTFSGLTDATCPVSVKSITHYYIYGLYVMIIKYFVIFWTLFRGPEARYWPAQADLYQDQCQCKAFSSNMTTVVVKNTM